MNVNCLKNYKKVHLIQPMGGGGTRFLGKEINIKPLIEIQNKPFLYWSTISLNCNLIYDITFVVLKEHIEKYGIDKEIKKYFESCNIVVLDHILNGAVLTCMEGVKSINDDLPIVFNDCDHSFISMEFENFLEKWDKKIDGGFLSFKSNENKFSYIKYDKSGKIIGTAEKVVVSDDAICGTYYFKNKDTFLQYAEKYLNNCNYSEFFMSGVYNEIAGDNLVLKKFQTDIHLSFGTPDEYHAVKDSSIFNDIEKRNLSCQINKKLHEHLKDVEVLEDVSSGSDAFTFFIKDENGFAYRKIALSESGGVQKLACQLNFINQYEKELLLPKISHFNITEDYCSYDMSTDKEHMRMVDFIEKSDEHKSIAIILDIMDNLSKFHKKYQLQFNDEALKKYISEKIFKNALSIINLDAGEYIKSISKYDEIQINGKYYKNLSYYFGSYGTITYDKLYNLFKNDPCSIIHGDLTIDNIICDEKHKRGYYLIDPNVGNPYMSSFLDYSKMLQSLHGNYEWLKFAKIKNIDSDKIIIDFLSSPKYNFLYKAFVKNLEENFSPMQVASIFYHEIAHWLRLMPYKIRKDEKSALIYYCELIMLLDDITKRFG